MKTHFVTVEIELKDSPIDQQTAIETELQKHGEPLRWAVTSVSVDQQMAYVEAIVIIQHD